MKITIVIDNIGNDSIHEYLAQGLTERGHEVITVCFDESYIGKEGYIVAPRLRPVGSEALETAIWDSDAVYICAPSQLGLAAIRQCSAHCIPVAAGFSKKDVVPGFRKFRKHNPHCDMMRLRHIYRGYLQKADAVIYHSFADERAFEFAADIKDNGYVIPSVTDEGALDRFEEIMEAIHI